ncbi:exocyst complex component protein [Coprinopsis marcescibilis]|uniref:Exocyst complex component protein n=1 Tax=Coprinopsis marcescibilis TaxID=230819 RepID=A0A5C3L7W3_COPMA|nr:exocyst complex component protein [Coprinopsis marcescibilis]
MSSSNIPGPPEDADIAEQLQLSTFKGKFDVTEFVGGVSERLIAKSKADSGPFNPKPFIRTFEAAVDRLMAIRKEVDKKTEQMEKSVRVAEREYSKKMADLSKNFETVGNSFTGMESRMNLVSSTAVRIVPPGDQLETVHIERQRAQAACDLIDHYNQFSKGDTSRLDTLRKEGRTGRRQVAVILRRLNTVAKEVDLPDAEKTREAIEKYCEKFEKEMLSLFDRCYRKGDPKMMHHCAQTLLEFNGGSSCVQVYVNQHDFFINNVREGRSADDTHLWSNLGDPDASAPKAELGLSDLFQEIRTTVDTETQIVKAVFPNPPVVMQVFLQRVFAQSIQQYMEQLLHRGSDISDLGYLRILQLVHIQASSLVEDLKAHELPSMASRTPYEAAEFRRSITGAAPAQLAMGTPAAISTMLETAMEELFVPYTEGQRYLERENKSLAFLYTGLLAPFTKYHKSQRGKASMFDRMVNQISATSGTSATSSQAAAALTRFGLMNASSANQQGEEPAKEEDGILSVEVTERMLKWHAEAVGRCVELSPPNDVPKSTFSLLKVLSEALGNNYVELAIETQQIRLEAADNKSEPSLYPLTVIKHVDLICHLWQQYVNVAIFPLASPSVTVRRETVLFNTQTMNRIESATNQLLQKVTDVAISWLSLQLTKQKKDDFKPKNDELSFARVNTRPCEACCDSLEKVRDAAKENLSGKNLEVFLTEIGVAFHSLLLEHMRKFPVSATGGLMLAKDLKSYQDTISTFGVPALQERFEFIRQLGQIFLIQPEILKSFITENYLGRIESSLLRPYIALRSDWGQFEKGFNNPEALPEEGNAGTALKDRFGRLSLMMKELESLKPESLSVGMPSIPASFTGNFSMPSMPSRPF